MSACSSKDETAKQEEHASTNQERPVSVHVVSVKKQDLQTWIYSQGTARSRQREFLTFTQPGQITHVDENLRVGSIIRKGQVLAYQAPERLTAELAAAKAGLAQAKADLDFSHVTQQRYEALIEQRSAAKQELDRAIVQVEQAKAAYDSAKARLAQAQLNVNESRLTSPINGVLARLNIERGRYFTPATVQTTTEQSALRSIPAVVIDPTRFEIRVDFPSYHFQEIKQAASALIGGDPPVDGHDIDPSKQNTPVAGQVYAISPTLDPESRTFEVIVHTKSDNPGLQDGQFVGVWVKTPSLKDALAVPTQALRQRSDESFVYVLDKESSRVSERLVEVGQQSGNYRVVITGLKEGELVVTDGRAALNSGQKVQLLGDAGGKP